MSENKELSSSLSFDGPQSSGEHVSQVVEVAIRYPILTGRILNEEGRVGKGIDLQAELRSQNQYPAKWRRLRTNRKGIFRIPLRSEVKNIPFVCSWLPQKQSLHEK